MQHLLSYLNTRINIYFVFCFLIFIVIQYIVIKVIKIKFTLFPKNLYRKQYIDDFLNNKLGKNLIIDGSWGIGKTYYIQQLFNFNINNSEYKLSILKKILYNIYILDIKEIIIYNILMFFSLNELFFGNTYIIETLCILIIFSIFNDIYSDKIIYISVAKLDDKDNINNLIINKINNNTWLNFIVNNLKIKLSNIEIDFSNKSVFYTLNIKKYRKYIFILDDIERAKNPNKIIEEVINNSDIFRFILIGDLKLNKYKVYKQESIDNSSPLNDFSENRIKQIENENNKLIFQKLFLLELEKYFEIITIDEEQYEKISISLIDVYKAFFKKYYEQTLTDGMILRMKSFLRFNHKRIQNIRLIKYFLVFYKNNKDNFQVDIETLFYSYILYNVYSINNNSNLILRTYVFRKENIVNYNSSISTLFPEHFDNAIDIDKIKNTIYDIEQKEYQIEFGESVTYHEELNDSNFCEKMTNIVDLINNNKLDIAKEQLKNLIEFNTLYEENSYIINCMSDRVFISKFDLKGDMEKNIEENIYKWYFNYKFQNLNIKTIDDLRKVKKLFSICYELMFINHSKFNIMKIENYFKYYKKFLIFIIDNYKNLLSTEQVRYSFKFIYYEYHFPYYEKVLKDILKEKQLSKDIQKYITDYIDYYKGVYNHV